MEKELTTAVTTQEPMLAESLIVVQQLPVIKEQLHSIKAQAQASVAEALALVCTEETLKVVKEQRAKLNRDRKDLDDRRAVVKKQIMKPFEDFDKVYKECVTDVYGPADEALKGKITDVEAGLKADKEKKVVAYFDELVKANGVEWVSYGNIGIAVTMTASLKSLKSKVKDYVDRVVADVNCINGMENAPEVMAEYIPFSAELVTGSKTSHAGGIKKVGLPTAVDDLDQAVQFFDSHYASDKMRSINITVYAEGIPEAIHNSAPGVERARCSFSVNFMQCTKGYAALAPSIGDYSEDHDSAAAKDVADVEAGWFDKAEVKRELENK